MSPCIVSVKINGEQVLGEAEVPGEDQGRTTHDIHMEGLADGDGSIEVSFDEGDGCLFLWKLEIEVSPHH